MRRTWLGILVAFVVVHGSLAAAGETAEVKIKRALSAAPPEIAKNAKVMDMDAKGNMTTLREGTNGFTCFPGTPGVVGDVAMCADPPAMQWLGDAMAHKLLGPDRKDVALAVGEVESLSAGEVERGDDDGTTGGDDCILRGFQVLRIEDYQGGGVALALLWITLAESAIDASVISVEGDVVGAVVLEIPAKGFFIERLGAGDVGGGEFDVVDRVVLGGFAHPSLLMIWDA
jgi:hypothetical protein